MVKARDVITIAALVMSAFGQASAAEPTVNRLEFQNCVDEAFSVNLQSSDGCLALDQACRKDLQKGPEWKQRFTCDIGVKTCLDEARDLADLNMRECLPPGTEIPRVDAVGAR
jgi:hypothetical protein